MKTTMERAQEIADRFGWRMPPPYLGLLAGYIAAAQDEVLEALAQDLESYLTADGCVSLCERTGVAVLPSDQIRACAAHARRMKHTEGA